MLIVCSIMLVASFVAFLICGMMMEMISDSQLDNFMKYKCNPKINKIGNIILTLVAGFYRIAVVIGIFIQRYVIGKVFRFLFMKSDKQDSGC